MLRKRSRVLVLVSSLSVAFIPASAQSTAGRIEGTVMDSSGAVVPEATVLLVGSETARQWQTVSNELGYYTFALVPPGRYQLLVEKQGFQKVSRSNLIMEVDQVARVDFTMTLGAVAETIEITAQSPLLQVSNSSLGQVIENRQITDLPLNTRTALGLLGLTAGVTVGRGFDANTFNNANLFSAGGSRPGQNEFLLDGAPNTLPGIWPGRGILGVTVPVDSIQEFKVQTNAFSAEFGRSGGGLINTVSKSGTNDLHGSLFHYLRNSKLDANNFFNNRNDIPLGNFKRNQFGGTVGGPIVRTKTFFFANYQATRAREAANSTFTVPIEPMRRGDFSSLTSGGQPVVIFDPLTTQTVGGNPIREPFPGNVIPANRINPVAAKLVANYPAPNRPGTINNLVLSASRPRDNDIIGARVDHSIATSHQINGRFYYTRDDDLNPDWYRNDATPGNLGLTQDVYSLATDYVYTASPTMLLNVRYGYSRRTHDNSSRSLGMDLTSLGFPQPVQQENPQTTYPSIGASGYGSQGWSDGINAFSYITHSIQASATKVFSAHTLKFGGDLRFNYVPQERGINLSGNYSFNAGFTQGPNANRGGPTAGDSIASLLLGTPASGSFGTHLLVEGVNDYTGLYIQDDWRITPQLTLNLGLRYELEDPRTERENRLDWFDFNVLSPLNDQVAGLGPLRGGLRFAGVDGNPIRHFDTDKNNFAPRFGFAYQLQQQTVVRGGYGIFFGSGSIGAGGWNIASQGYAPSTTFVGSLDGLRPITTLSNPFPEGFSQPVGNSLGLLSLVGENVPRVYDRNAPLPYNQQWNFSIQRQFGSVLVETAYLGSRGIYLGDGAGHDINQLLPQTLALGTALQQLVPNPFYGIITTPGVLSQPTVTRGQLLRPYPHFGNLNIFNPASAASTYHGFTLKAERRFASGLGFLVSYTTSKNISDAPATVGPAAGHQNAYDRRSDRSLVEEDIAQRLVVSGSWQLPLGRGRQFGAGWNRALEGILGGWQLNSIVSVQSGTPLVISNTPNTARALGGGQRPNSDGFSAAKSGRIQDRLESYMDAEAFSVPEPFTFGNVGRTLPDVRGPRYSNVDLSVAKTFPVRENIDLQLRGEIFNAFNTPIFGLPNQAFGNRQFGTITSQANDPRQVQLALRLVF
jgi:hypothetical protein